MRRKSVLSLYNLIQGGVSAMKPQGINLDKVNLIAVRSSTPGINSKAKNQSAQEPKETVSITDSGLFKSVSPKAVKEEKWTEQKSLRNDSLGMHDGFDSSRDIRGVEAKEGKPHEPYRFKVKLTHLRPGAELGNLDVYTLVSLGKETGETKLPDDIPGVTSQPWNLAVGKYDSKNFKVVDDSGNQRPDSLSGVKFDSLHNTVEFSLNKNILREKGWKDGEPLKLQVFTAKDFVKQVTDSLDEPAKKPWVNDGKLTHYFDTSDPQSVRPKRAENWAEDTIYFLLTDRFEDGDPTNNYEVNKSDLRRFHGGDLQGIINRMDYLKDLGVSTIWINPVFQNQKEFIDTAGYHGYWPIDFEKVEEHQGDWAKLKEMVDLAHEKDMKVILDVPLNHVAWDHPWRKDPEKHDWFHNMGDIVDWNDPYQVEHGDMYGLPDLAQGNPEVYDYLLNICKNVIDKTGVDGFRLDAVMHINKSFWDKFNKDIKDHAGPDFYMVGEVFHGDPKVVAPYQDRGMPGLFDMPLYFTTKDTFAHDGSMKNLAAKVRELDNAYDNPHLMAAFIDNHDTDRFMTVAGHNGKEKLSLALAFLMTLNRIPVIYYGTEQAMTGRNEHMGSNPPENRAMMEFENDPGMQAYFTKLATIRNESSALKEGAMLEMWEDDQIYAFSRITPDDEAVVVLNNSYDNQYREIPIRKESEMKDGTVLKDALSGQEYTIQNGKLKINLNRKQPAILLKK